MPAVCFGRYSWPVRPSGSRRCSTLASSSNGSAGAQCAAADVRSAKRKSRHASPRYSRDDRLIGRKVSPRALMDPSFPRTVGFRLSALDQHPGEGEHADVRGKPAAEIAFNFHDF